ncbi:hypothetical protein JKP88DRAFT_289434 [Tribonema minus]|uniref:Uncharacterized protein n=1 Tax=Tribonema minus TaxID=303371 RepID=A0A835Z514_9STRA|nr:hypothetical protein JKP88DRAFT_289434 [Tribonema minus]
MVKSLIALVAVACVASLGDAMTCGPDNTGVTDADGKVCCPAMCGECGVECKTRFPGSEEWCCVKTIKAAGVPCGKPPCVLQAAPPQPTAPPKSSPKPTAPLKPSPQPTVAKTPKPTATPPTPKPTIAKTAKPTPPPKTPKPTTTSARATDDPVNPDATKRPTGPRASPKPTQQQTAAQGGCGRSGGGKLSEDGKACCAGTCKQCGGTGCANAPDTAEDCCVGTITRRNIPCAMHNAPCVTHPAPKKTCGLYDQGTPGLKGIACCPARCGDICGGDNCSTVYENSAPDCCASEIIAKGDSCDTHIAPCVIPFAA